MYSTWQAPGAWKVEESEQARRKSAALVKQNGKRAREQSEKQKNSAPSPSLHPKTNTYRAMVRPFFVTVKSCVSCLLVMSEGRRERRVRRALERSERNQCSVIGGSEERRRANAPRGESKKKKRNTASPGRLPFFSSLSRPPRERKNQEHGPIWFARTWKRAGARNWRAEEEQRFQSSSFPAVELALAWRRRAHPHLPSIPPSAAFPSSPPRRAH